MKGPARLPKQNFFDDPLIDAIVNSLTGLAMELSVVRERLDTLERALLEQGIQASELIERHVPDQETKLARVQARMDIIKAALDPLRDHFANRGSSNLPKT